ncbi:MAG: S24 family peptidase, partial [Isosphaeraceae bacterium]
LNLPARTWYNYETGVTVPAEVLLAFIDQTGTNPHWLLNGEGPKYRHGLEDMVLSELTPEQLIRRGLEKLEETPNEVVLIAPENLPEESVSDFVAVGLVSLASLGGESSSSSRIEGYILAYRQWIPHPRETVAVLLDDDAMYPILPAGSVVAIDRAVRDPQQLQGRLVAARVEGPAMVRWLDISGRHLIFRPNQPSREHPIIPVELDQHSAAPIVGQVVWSWSRFARP